MPHGFGFDVAVARGGYAWWYLDAESDDGAYALSIILFVGSVFSPYYRRAAKRQSGKADDHIALNVGLYGRHKAWSFAERRLSDGGSRTPNRFVIGASEISYDKGQYKVVLDEKTSPWGQPLRGRVTLSGALCHNPPQSLDGAGNHLWAPLVPNARVFVELTSPKAKWSGHAYLDANRGSRPLTQDFASWDWMRLRKESGTLVAYDAQCFTRARAPSTLFYRNDGTVEAEAPAAPVILKRSKWWLIQKICARVVSLEIVVDTPFYTRSRAVGPDGSRGMHETLDLRRWSRRWVQFLLPFRMSRLRHGGKSDLRGPTKACLKP